MPTYDYECTSCNKVIEIFQQMSDEPLQKCPECGKKIKRLVGGGLGVIFKGNGFYVTDSKKNKSSVASAGASSGVSTASSTQSEKKPAAKTASTAGSKSNKE